MNILRSDERATNIGCGYGDKNTGKFKHLADAKAPC